ncbi:MAG: ComEC/Rec2 family competence protein, partial [Bryobacteraceae bacterium]
LAGLGFVLLGALALWKARGVAMLPCLAVFAVVGAVTSELHRPATPPSLDIDDGETALLSGCIADVPSYAGDRVRFALELARGARIRITLSFRPGEIEPRLYYGQRVEVEAKVRSPRNFGNPGAFDYVGYLARQEVFWLASARGADKVKILPGRCGPSWNLASFRAWEFLAGRIDQLYGIETYEASMMRGMLLGDSSGIQKVWTEHFRRTHVPRAGVSGLHITVLAGTMLALLRWIRCLPAYALFLRTNRVWLRFSDGHAGTCSAGGRWFPSF